MIEITKMQRSNIMKVVFILLAVLISPSFVLDAKPAQVIIIRHGEKPETGEHLSVKGKERAAALAPYFLNTPSVLKYGPPAAIYATEVTPQNKSYRTQETVTPLAKALGLEIKTPFSDAQVTDLAKEVLSNSAYDGKMVLICWEHHNIPSLAYALGVRPEPPRWHGHVFDQVWLLNFEPDGQVSLEAFSQELMFGDTRNKSFPFK